MPLPRAPPRVRPSESVDPAPRPGRRVRGGLAFRGAAPRRRARLRLPEPRDRPGRPSSPLRLLATLLPRSFPPSGGKFVAFAARESFAQGTSLRLRFRGAPRRRGSHRAGPTARVAGARDDARASTSSCSPSAPSWTRRHGRAGSPQSPPTRPERRLRSLNRPTREGDHESQQSFTLGERRRVGARSRRTRRRCAGGGNVHRDDGAGDPAGSRS